MYIESLCDIVYIANVVICDVEQLHGSWDQKLGGGGGPGAG